MLPSPHSPPPSLVFLFRLAYCISPHHRQFQYHNSSFSSVPLSCRCGFISIIFIIIIVVDVVIILVIIAIIINVRIIVVVIMNITINTTTTNNTTTTLTPPPPPTPTTTLPQLPACRCHHHPAEVLTLLHPPLPCAVAMAPPTVAMDAVDWSRTAV